MSTVEKIVVRDKRVQSSTHKNEMNIFSSQSLNKIFLMYFSMTWPEGARFSSYFADYQYTLCWNGNKSRTQTD